VVAAAPHHVLDVLQGLLQRQVAVDLLPELAVLNPHEEAQRVGGLQQVLRHGLVGTTPAVRPHALQGVDAVLVDAGRDGGSGAAEGLVVAEASDLYHTCQPSSKGGRRG